MPEQMISVFRRLQSQRVEMTLNWFHIILSNRCSKSMEPIITVTCFCHNSCCLPYFKSLSGDSVFRQDTKLTLMPHLLRFVLQTACCRLRHCSTPRIWALSEKSRTTSTQWTSKTCNKSYTLTYWRTML